MVSSRDARANLDVALREDSLDAIVASSPPNVCYTSGTYFTTMKTVPQRTAFVVATGADPTFIYCTIEEGHASEESWLTDLVGYTEFVDEPVEVLVRVLRAKGVASGRIGVEFRNLCARDRALLGTLLPEAELVPADDIFDAMRAVKTPREIDVLGAAARSTDAAIRAAFEGAAIGDTGFSVADSMVAAAKSAGAQTLLHQTMAVGTDGFKVHASASDRRLAAGDVLRADFSMTWDGHYLSDVARTAFVGEISRAQLDLYARLESVQHGIFSFMRPGVPASAVFVHAKELFGKVGVTFDFPHVGHSIGLGLHENPMLHSHDHTVLAPGMVFMVEPLVRGSDGIYHVEDMVVITEDGSKVLTRAIDWSTPMVVG
jgi:Xaa-Pro aminopeptidase